MGCTPSKNPHQIIVDSTSRPQSRPVEKQGLVSSQSQEQEDFNHNGGPGEQSHNAQVSKVSSPKPPIESNKKSEENLVRSSPKKNSTPVKKVRIKSAKGGPDRIATDQFHQISYEKASQLQVTDPEEMWAIVKGTSDREGIQIEPTKNRKGWRTIRIFVSSTFKDFHQEREVLVKEVGSC